MKIKKFNEQINNLEYQHQEIKEVFLDLIDNKKAFITDEDNEHFMNLYFPIDNIEGALHSYEELDKYINTLNYRIDLFSLLRNTLLKRLDDLNYEWEIEDLNYEISLSVYFSVLEPTIENAFGTNDDIFINTSILKKVLKDKYNLTYITHNIRKNIDSYNNIDQFVIYVKENISNDTFQRLKSDIRKITKGNAPFKGNPFLNIEKGQYLNSDNIRTYFITLDFSN